MRLIMRYSARRPSPPALYFAALDFFLAAHRALAASDRRLRRAGDIDLFLAGVDFFGAAEFAAVALCTGIISSEPSKSASRIFVRRSISFVQFSHRSSYAIRLEVEKSVSASAPQLHKVALNVTQFHENLCIPN